MDPLNILAKFEVRSFMRSWDNRECFKNLGSPWIRQRPLFPQIFKGLLFAWTLWIYLPNLNFVALRVLEIIGGTGKIWAVPGYSHNLGRFVTRIISTENWLSTPWILPRSLFSQIFKRLLLGWTPWIHLPNLKFVALRIPEIIGGTGKISAVPVYTNSPFTPKFLKGVCMDPLNILVKFEVRSFTHSSDNRGYFKKFGSPWIRQRSLSPKFPKVFCFHVRCEYICQIWTS